MVLMTRAAIVLQCSFTVLCFLLIAKFELSSDYRLKFACMKEDLIVISK